MKPTKVLLGMSGGVDSAVAALLLQRQGFEVRGCTFNFAGDNLSMKKDLFQVKELAKQLNIEHTVVDLSGEFNDIVIQYFIQGYQSGKTPFPCAVCNPEVKWKNLLLQATKLQCNYIATGHYVRNILFKESNYIFQGIDPEKDQSFFLWGLSTKYLKQTLFPLGEFKKEEVRKIAENAGFKKLSRKKDSLGICFLQDKNYRNYLAKNIKITRGNFVDLNGNILGNHSGYMNYTVGQRRGLGINANKPLFVSEIKAETNEVVLSDFNSLFRNRVVVSNYFFNNPKEITPDKEWNVKIRYRNQDTPCKINILDSKRLEINLLSPLESIAPGQTAVFYDDERVVGGGFIKSAD